MFKSSNMSKLAVVLKLIQHVNCFKGNKFTEVVELINNILNLLNSNELIERLY